MLAQVSLMAGRRSRFMAVNISWVLVILMLADMVCAQGPAPSPSSSSGGCDDTVGNLAPCLEYITANDTTPPSKDCCTGLVTVVNENIICLCTVLRSGSNYGITINQTRAAAMPAACKVETPPLSACAALAPSPSPTAGSNTHSPVLSPSATAEASGNFRPSPFSVFTGLLLAGFGQVLI